LYVLPIRTRARVAAGVRSFARRVPPWSAALAGYLILALLLFLPVWLQPGQRTVGGGGGDPFFSSWFIRWIPHAISHGWNPLFTTYLDYPDGVNLMWNGSIPLPSLVVAPVTLTAGPMVAYNLLITAGTVEAGPLGQTVVLEAGDFLRFTADVPHMYAARSTDAFGVVVMTYPYHA